MNDFEMLTWEELMILYYETQETHDSRLRKRIKDEINRRHKYE
jgi:hypothetical protein